MATGSNPPYYSRYEERYRQVYAQGVPYWSGFPDEMEYVRGRVERFLETFALEPGRAEVVEFGCGEGFVAELLARRGYRYTGADLAPSGVAKARERVAPFTEHARVIQADITDPSWAPADSFDAALDVMCVHMLLVDADRLAYLRNACRVLKAGAPMLFCHELFRPDATAAVIRSYDEWVRLSGGDYETPGERDAWRDGQPVRIRLPLLPARERTVEQYEAELCAAGFEGMTLCEPAQPPFVSFYARKPA